MQKIDDIVGKARRSLAIQGFDPFIAGKGFRLPRNDLRQRPTLPQAWQISQTLVNLVMPPPIEESDTQPGRVLQVRPHRRARPCSARIPFNNEKAIATPVGAG